MPEEKAAMIGGGQMIAYTGTYNKAMYEAINAAAKAMPSLRKGDKNPSQGYAYVSIDDYYEHAAKVAHAHGLSWTSRELSCDLVQVGEKADRQGNVNPVYGFKVKYAFDLFHDGGSAVRDFFTTTIFHPMQGAQTAGSALSYAAKLFLRTTFAIVTGEGDADATDNKAFDTDAADPFSMDNKPAPQTRRTSTKKPVEKVSDHTGDPEDQRVLQQLSPEGRMPGEDEDAEKLLTAAEVAIKFLSLAKTEDELRSYWVSNEKLFADMKANAPDEYKRVVDAFSKRKAELKK